MSRLAQELLRVAKELIAEDDRKLTPIDGMNRRQACRFVNAILARHTKGLFRDDSWQPVQAIWKELSAEGITWQLENAEYQHDAQGRTTSKVWKFKVLYRNDRGVSPTILYGVITASGAGSVSDPLEKYDLVAYVS
jgi:hypothetical protein